MASTYTQVHFVVHACMGAIAFMSFLPYVSVSHYVYHGDMALSWYDANAFCEFSYGTKLASVHNTAQNSEAGLLCSGSSLSDECWIDAMDIYWNTHLQDATPTNLANTNEYCASISQGSNHWHYDHCHKEKHILCNYPTAELHPIKTNNANIDPFNYLCDDQNRFTIIKGDQWSIDKSHCWLRQNAETGDAHVSWLGDKDPTSIQWSDYKVEFVVNILHGDARAEAGLLFRTQSVSTNVDAQYYYLNIRNNEGIRFNKMAYDTLDTIYTYSGCKMQFNHDYTLRIEAISDTFTVYLDNKRIFTQSDTVYTHGSIGFRTFHAIAIFKRLRIIFPDSVASSIADTDNTRRLLQHLTPPQPQPRIARVLHCGDRITGDYDGEPISITFTMRVSSDKDLMFDTRESTFTVANINVFTGAGVYIMADSNHDGILLLKDAGFGDYKFIIYGNDDETGTFVVEMQCFSPGIHPPWPTDKAPVIVTTQIPYISDHTILFISESTVLIIISISILCVCILCLCLVCTKMIRSKQRKQYIRSMTMVRLDQRVDIDEELLTLSALEAQAFKVAIVENWLTNECTLPQYVPHFINNGYDSMDIIKAIEHKFELEQIGIRKHAHQIIILSQIRVLIKKEKLQASKNAKPVPKQVNQMEVMEPGALSFGNHRYHQPAQAVLVAVEGGSDSELLVPNIEENNYNAVYRK